jgi:putative addiction module component (TIGR02574 family)
MADTATIEALLSLPVDERAEIAELLLESLNPPSEGPHRDAWNKEISARYAAWELKEIASTDAFEVFRRLRKTYSFAH